MRLSVLAFLGGVLWVQFSPTLPSLWWACLLLPAGLIAVRWRLAIPVVFFLFGLAWTAWRAGLVLETYLSPALEGQDLTVEGHIADLPRATDRAQRFIFDIEKVVGVEPGTLRVPPRVQLSNYDRGFVPHAGDRWRLVVRLKQPHGFQNPGGFDYEAHLFQQRIRALGYIRQHPAPVALPADIHGYRIGRAREWLGAAMRAALPDRPFVPMLVAFVNGDEQGITNDQWRVLQRTGTTHLIAISGMNIGFVAGLAFVLTMRIWSWPGYTVLWWPAQKVGAVAAMLAAVGYAALAGFAIPTQRALIMVCTLMIGIVFSRRAVASHLLAGALFVVLLYDPLAAMSAGFWLSFISVAVILFFLHGDHTRPRWRQWGRVQWSISLGLMPVTVLLFQQIPIVGPVANLLAIPIIEIAVIPLSLVSALLLVPGIASVAGWLLSLADRVLAGLWLPLSWLAQHDGLQWTQHGPALSALLLAGIGTAWLLAPRGWPARWLGAIWLMPMFLVRPPSPQAGEVWLALLDVGQGLATVVRTAHHTLVFDTGARFSNRFDAGRSVVVPYLRAEGVDAVDMLVVSHGDNDHIGGANSLREGVPVRAMLSGVPERIPGAQPCSRGQRWSWDGVDLEVLNPGHSWAKDNDGSCVLLVRSSYGQALLPADIEMPAEQELVERYGAKLKSQVLVAPHHGSKTSSSEDFVGAVSPQHILYPTGYRNRYHHPHPSVVARYAAGRVVAHDSPTNGAIEVRLVRDRPVVWHYRERERRYWFATGLARESGL